VQTKTYKLYDDGTHGDTFANNHYWSAELTDLGLVEGNYHYHYVVTITYNGETFRREADQTIFVEVKIDPEKTTTSVEDLGMVGGRQNTRFTFTPMDEMGNLLGPGRQDFFELETTGDAKIEGEVREDGKGRYEVVVSWSNDQGPPNLTLTQNGQPRQVVLLPENNVQPSGPREIMDHKQGPIDPEYTVPCGPSRITVIADTNRIYCIDYSISGGMVRGATLNTADKILVLPIHPMTNTSSTTQPGMAEGSITLDIPRSILDSKTDGTDNKFTIMRNQESADYEEEVTNSTRKLTIMLPEKTSEVQVMGTTAIPEFPSMMTVVVFASTVAAIVAFTTIVAKGRLRFGR
jgi:hypothetical protein